MKRIAILSALMLAGCVQVPDGPKPDDTKPAGTVARAAAESIEAYRERLAVEWQKTADTASSFSDWQPAYEDLQRRLKAAREESFRKLTDACDRETGTGDVKYGAAILERVAREAADGFRKGK